MHTKEPWKPVKRLQDMVRTDDDVIAIFISDNALHDCARTRACVNALAGMNPEAVGDVVGTVRQVIQDLQEAEWIFDEPCDWRTIRDILGGQSAKLEAVLAKLEDVNA